MNRTVCSIILSFVVLAGASHLYASGQRASAPETATTTKEGAPRYGGTFTGFWPYYQQEDPPNPDIMAGFWQPTQWLNPVQERPIIGDFEKYGPRGAGEFKFQLKAYIPEKYLKGNLIESWEITPQKTVWHVRPGIMWQARKGVMEARELVAQDFVEDMLRFAQSPRGGGFKKMFTNIHADGKYTVVIETPSFDSLLMYYVGYEDAALISPPEMVKAGPDKWENQVGTGPFTLKEYVIGSHVTYEKNPNYWGTTTINGVKYKLPFVDQIVFPIVPDHSTQIALLRTGKLDYYSFVPSQDWQSLDQTAPGIKSLRISGSTGWGISLNTTRTPLDKMEVRRALMIGTNLKAFADLERAGELPLHWFPEYYGNPEVYTPLKDLPASTQLLYSNDPARAKQVLAEAGYPNGFSMELLISTRPADQDRASLIKDMWSKLGVQVSIKTVEWAQAQTLTRAGNFEAWLVEGEVGNPVSGIQQSMTGNNFNSSRWSNPKFDALASRMLAETDAAKRAALSKEASLILLDQVPRMPIEPIAEGYFWWPWLRNYYGETNVEDQDILPVITRMWIDQDMKKQMGH